MIWHDLIWYDMIWHDVKLSSKICSDVIRVKLSSKICSDVIRIILYYMIWFNVSLTGDGNIEWERWMEMTYARKGRRRSLECIFLKVLNTIQSLFISQLPYFSTPLYHSSLSCLLSFFMFSLHGNRVCTGSFRNPVR